MPSKYDPFEASDAWAAAQAGPGDPMGSPPSLPQRTSTRPKKVLVSLPHARRDYTYHVYGRVSVGDRVVVPGPPWAPDQEQSGTVKALGSSYDGPTVEARLAI